MQNRSFNEHYYKIKNVIFSVLHYVGRRPVFGIASNIRHEPGCTASEDGVMLFPVVRKRGIVLSM